MTDRQYSISITYGLDNWELIFKILFEEYFSGIELPAYYLNSIKLPELINNSYLKITNIIDLVQNSISRGVIDQNDKVKSDIFEYINSTINKNYEFEFNCFTLDLGFSPDSPGKDTSKHKVNFLKRFMNTLYSKNMTMLLPVRIPDTPPINIQGVFIQEILHDVMFNKYKVCLNLYPHEVKRRYNPKSVLQWYDFDLKAVRIIYEPEIGNSLTEKLLKYWLEPLDNIRFKGDIIFCPKTTSFSLLESEIRKLTGFIDKI